VNARTLRAIAADWHGGQSSALYAFASSGHISPALDAEIAECVELARGDAVELARLADLRAAIAER
jgi:hypothetical protein